MAAAFIEHLHYNCSTLHLVMGRGMRQVCLGFLDEKDATCCRKYHEPRQDKLPYVSTRRNSEAALTCWLRPILLAATGDPDVGT
jgi:hypothetical protein